MGDTQCSYFAVGFFWLIFCTAINANKSKRALLQNPGITVRDYSLVSINAGDKRFSLDCTIYRYLRYLNNFSACPQFLYLNSN